MSVQTTDATVRLTERLFAVLDHIRSSPGETVQADTMSPKRATHRTDGTDRRRHGTTDDARTRATDRTHHNPGDVLQRTVGNSAIQRHVGTSGRGQQLAIDGPGDDHEREANRVAAAVIGSSPCQPDTTRNSGREDHGHESKVECLACGDTLQRYAADSPTTTGDTSQVDGAPPSVAGTGRRLPGGTRSFFEQQMGRDFGRVRIHTGSGANSAARAVGARAFTVGENVVFGRGAYSPGTLAGKRLLAHELTHVVQQRARSHQSQALLQRKQVGRPPFPTGETSVGTHFLYELDDERRTYAELAADYGVNTRDVMEINEKGARSLQRGDRIRVPAIDLPPSTQPYFQPPDRIPLHLRYLGAMENVVVNETSANLNARWNSQQGANVVGTVSRATTVLSASQEGMGPAGGRRLTFVNLADFQTANMPILVELRLRNRVIDGHVATYLPEASLRADRGPTSSEVDLLARMIWGEQRSVTQTAMRAAAWIARNRVEAGFGTYTDVITDPGDFQGLVGPEAVENLEGVDKSRWEQAQQIARQVTSGQSSDPTGGALFFGNGTEVKRDMEQCANENDEFSWGRIGSTSFYYSNGNYSTETGAARCRVPPEAPDSVR